MGSVIKLLELLVNIALKLTQMGFQLMLILLKAAFNLIMGLIANWRSKGGYRKPVTRKRRRRKWQSRYR